MYHLKSTIIEPSHFHNFLTSKSNAENQIFDTHIVNSTVIWTMNSYKKILNCIFFSNGIFKTTWK